MKTQSQVIIIYTLLFEKINLKKYIIIILMTMIFFKLFSKCKVVGTSLIQYVYIRFVGRYSHYCCTVGIFVRWQINITVLTKKKK